MHFRGNKVLLRIPEKEEFIFSKFGSKAREEYLTVISVTKAWKSLKKGRSGYLAYVMHVGKGSSKSDDILVAREFRDVFLEKQPDVPPEREIEFEINLIPKTDPISKALY